MGRFLSFSVEESISIASVNEYEWIPGGPNALVALAGICREGASRGASLPQLSLDWDALLDEAVESTEIVNL